MSWLEEQESKMKDWNDLLYEFDKSIVPAKNIYNRIRDAFKHQLCMLENMYKTSCVFEGYGKTRHWREGLDENHENVSHKIEIKLTGENKIPVIKLFETKTTWADMYKYDADAVSDDKWRSAERVFEWMQFETFISITNLSIISEDEWITAFGWLIEKTNKQEITTLLKKYSIA